MPIRFLDRLNKAVQDFTGLHNSNMQTVIAKQFVKNGYEMTGDDGSYIYVSNGKKHYKIDIDGNTFETVNPVRYYVSGAIGEKKQKAPDMPKVEPEDGIERYDAYTRLNPKGHKELVSGDDEETLNELSEDIDGLLEGSGGLKKIAKQQQERNADLDENPFLGFIKRIIDGELEAAEIQVEEGVEFAGPKSTGGGAGSPEQAEYNRRRNKFTPQLVNSDNDPSREAGDTITNMTFSTKQASDGPEQSRAKYKTKVSNKNIIGYSGMSEGQIRKIADVIEESFTGTGAIAISPVGGYDPVSGNASGKKKKKKKSKDLTETDMNRQHLSSAIENILKEWQPSFDGGEYSPGEAGVEAGSGEGVADRKVSKEPTGKAPANMDNHGEPLGASHNETAAMCDVEESGVETKPQGSHESSVGDPTDGCCDEVGHDWPAQPSQDGGSNEEVEGQSYDKGGILKAAEASDMEAGRTKGAPKLEKGMAESWSLETISSLMEGEDGNIQSLFDKYAKEYNIVCLEDFQAICNANAKGVTLNMDSMLKLMESNKDFIFYEGHDANGPYWTPTPIAEAQIRPVPGSGDEFEDMGDYKDYQEKEKRMGPGPYDSNHCPECNEYCEGPQCTNCGCDIRGDEESVYGGKEEEGYEDVDDIDEMFSSYSNYDDEMDYDSFAYNVRNDLTPSDDDYKKFEESLKNFLGSAKSILENSAQHDPTDVGKALVASWNNYAGEFSPLGAPKKVQDTLRNLAESFPAFNILEGWEADYAHWMKRCNENPMQCAADFADFLGGGSLAKEFEAMANDPENTDYWMKGITGARNFGDAVQFKIANYFLKGNKLGVLRNSTETDAEALEESNTLSSPDGSEIGTGGHKPDQMADQPGPEDSKEHGHAGSGHKQANSYDKTPVIKGTGKGMSESKESKIMKDNISRLSRYVQKALKEGTSSLRGKASGQFNVVVSENGVLNRTPKRFNLTEALADAEEILQSHDSSDVDLEATFTDAKGSVVLQQEVPLFTIKPRGVVQSEGVSIFRFKRTAEKFADLLVSEGKVCRVIPHNWGHSVISG